MEIPLYENKIPNENPGADNETEVVENGTLKISKVRNPSLTVFLPPEEKATGAAVILCPGGGYWILATGHEGKDVAEKFAALGVAAFVLKYRLPDENISLDPSLAPIQDAQQAILLVRKRSKEWNIDSDKIGIMGFSAGGHLASTAGTHFDKTYIKNPENISQRPAFMILIYPVISVDTAISHHGSFERLLSKDASAQKKIQHFPTNFKLAHKLHRPF